MKSLLLIHLRLQCLARFAFRLQLVSQLGHLILVLRCKQFMSISVFGNALKVSLHLSQLILRLLLLAQQPLQLQLVVVARLTLLLLHKRQLLRQVTLLVLQRGCFGLRLLQIFFQLGHRSLALDRSEHLLALFRTHLSARHGFEFRLSLQLGRAIGQLFCLSFHHGRTTSSLHLQTNTALDYHLLDNLLLWCAVRCNLVAKCLVWRSPIVLRFDRCKSTGFRDLHSFYLRFL